MKRTTNKDMPGAIFAGAASLSLQRVGLVNNGYDLKCWEPIFAVLRTHLRTANIMMLRTRSRQNATLRNKSRTHIRVGSSDFAAPAGAGWSVAGSIVSVPFVCVSFGVAAESSRGKCTHVLFIVLVHYTGI